MKTLFSLLVVAGLTGTSIKLFATTFAIDSLDGDITANELKQFTNSIKTITPPTDNYNDNMSTHGTEVEGMRRMYEATGNMNILNRLIFVCDIELVNRNDQPQGDNRVMWDGTVAPGWPEGPTNTTPACTTGQINGNIAYCALLILETPSIWNLTIPDGNPYGYGVTYKQRATNYLAKVDQSLNTYITKWFVDTNTFKIRTPSDSRWLPASAQDTAETAWNRQALFCMGYQYSAQCHDVLGDNPSYLSLYKNIVNKFCSWFATAYPGGGSLYYTNSGIRVAKWWYQVPTDQHIENQGHAQHDMLGLYDGWESGYTTLTSSQMKVYADTTFNIINLGTTNSWADNVDGTGSSSYLKIDFIWLAQWNLALYKMIAQANIDAGQLNVDEGCKNTASILWMKHWMWVQSQDFSMSASPSSRTITPNSSTTYTVSLSAINGFNSSVGLTIGGLPAGATASFSPSSLPGSGSSTLTVTTGASTPTGNSTLTITGTGGGRTHSTTVTLVVNDFTISATPSSQTVMQGQPGTYTINLGSINGFNSAVNLSASSLPAGASATFSPSSVNPAGSSTLTVSTSMSTPIGSDSITVTGTSGGLSHSTSVTINVIGLPAGWTDADIGAVGLAGSAGYNAGTFTVTGSGADIWTAGDQFNYAYQSVSGDNTIIARVVSENGTQGFAKAGVMFRESVATNAVEACVLLTPANGVAMEVRPSTGANSINVSGWISMTAPKWIKLVRSGSTFTASYSADGNAWTQFASTNVTMAAGATAGLAVTAHDNTALNTATFDNVSIGANTVTLDTTKTYKLQNVASALVLNNQGSLTNGSAVTQWSATSSSTNLLWTFIPTSNGYYQIRSVKSGLDAVVQSASTASGAGIIQWSFGAAGNDQWRPVLNGDGTCTFYNLNSGLVLGDPGSSTSTSTQMDQETANGGANQKWNLLVQ